MRPSLWDRTPADFAAYARDPTELFARIARVDRWGPDGPELGRAAAHFCERFDPALPRIVREERSADGATKLVLATTDGSFATMPLPLTNVSVVAVPRSIARSFENKAYTQSNSMLSPGRGLV